MGNEAVHSMDDLILLISQHDVGDRVSLIVLRNGQELQVEVTLMARPGEL